MPIKPGSAPLPQCKAILLCGRANRDSDTGSWDIFGTFDTFVVPGFPGRTTAFTVFLKLVGGQGESAITVEVHSLHDGQAVLHSTPVPVTFADRLSPVVVSIACPPTIFTAPGKYDIIAFADGLEIERMMFAVQSLELGRDED